MRCARPEPIGVVSRAARPCDDPGLTPNDSHHVLLPPSTSITPTYANPSAPCSFTAPSVRLSLQANATTKHERLNSAFSDENFQEFRASTTLSHRGRRGRQFTIGPTATLRSRSGFGPSGGCGGAGRVR